MLENLKMSYLFVEEICKSLHLWGQIKKCSLIKLMTDTTNFCENLLINAYFLQFIFLIFSHVYNA